MSAFPNCVHAYHWRPPVSPLPQLHFGTCLPSAPFSMSTWLRLGSLNLPAYHFLHISTAFFICHIVNLSVNAPPPFAFLYTSLPLTSDDDDDDDDERGDGAARAARPNRAGGRWLWLRRRRGGGFGVDVQEYCVAIVIALAIAIAMRRQQGRTRRG